MRIRFNPILKKESNECYESLLNSSVTVVVCRHLSVTNLQRYILNHSPVLLGLVLLGLVLPRVSAFDPVQPRQVRANVPLPTPFGAVE
jgi:predicted anti-sigma-YlaC factor YlaD